MLALCVVVTVDCDRDIEEHFRRSLGRDYCNYLSQSTVDSTVQLSAAQLNGAVACSSAAVAPCNSAVVSSGATLSDLLTADADVRDGGCDVNKKCAAISITGVWVCLYV